jgi:hypothetical protein
MCAPFFSAPHDEVRRVPDGREAHRGVEADRIRRRFDAADRKSLAHALEHRLIVVDVSLRAADRRDRSEFEQDVGLVEAREALAVRVVESLDITMECGDLPGMGTKARDRCYALVV